LVKPTIGKPGKADLRQWPARVAITLGEGQIGLLALTRDAREGLAAFNEKREPQWIGK
jgi:hypothetical protein